MARRRVRRKLPYSEMRADGSKVTYRADRSTRIDYPDGSVRIDDRYWSRQDYEEMTQWGSGWALRPSRHYPSNK